MRSFGRGFGVLSVCVKVCWAAEDSQMLVGGQFHVAAALGPGNNPDTHRTGGWVGPRAGLGVFEKTKTILPLPGFDHRLAQPVA